VPFRLDADFAKRTRAILKTRHFRQDGFLPLGAFDELNDQSSLVSALRARNFVWSRRSLASFARMSSTVGWSMSMCSVTSRMIVTAPDVGEDSPRLARAARA
jgi:hypothetical protein